MKSLLKEFSEIIEKKDKKYASKINFKINYNNDWKKYEAVIIPLNKDFNLQDYFNNVLGGEEFAKESLEKGIFSLKLKEIY